MCLNLMWLRWLYNMTWILDFLKELAALWEALVEQICGGNEKKDEKKFTTMFKREKKWKAAVRHVLWMEANK